MDNYTFTSHPFEERSYVSFIKREIHHLTKNVFSEVKAAEIDIVVSELTSNVIKHAGKGELLYRLTQTETQICFEVICIDHGPGIKDVAHAMKDGISSTQTLGQGLGAADRLSTLFHLYSQPNWGTIAYSKVSAKPLVEHEAHLLIRSLLVCKPGEQVSGDGFEIRKRNDQCLLFLGDGLGHGENAHHAVREGIKYFYHTPEIDPKEIIKGMHVAIKKTRGLVGTVVSLNYKTKTWTLFGVGNISTRINQGLMVKNYTPYNGIIGLNIPNTVSCSEIPLEKYQYLIMCSDGIKTKIDLARYPHILKHDPIVLAAAIYKDHARRTDDMSVVVVKVL